MGRLFSSREMGGLKRTGHYHSKGRKRIAGIKEEIHKVIEHGRHSADGFVANRTRARIRGKPDEFIGG